MFIGTHISFVESQSDYPTTTRGVLFIEIPLNRLLYTFGNLLMNIRIQKKN